VRLSHSDLEACRANPKAWVSSKLTTSGGHPTFGYKQAVKLAIYTYHASNDSQTARQYLKDKLKRFADANRVAQCKDVLTSYIDWAESEGVIVADCKVRLNLPLENDLVLGGEISRVDIDPDDDSYRAVILGERPTGWRKELRFPLIQHEIASKYARPVGRVRIGFQNLDGSDLAAAQFTKEQIETSLEEASNISKSVYEEFARRMPKK